MLTTLEEANMISQDTTGRRSAKPKSAVRFSDEFEKRLSAYAACAVAAGVGLVATTKSADAKVVYTPANINIPLSQPVPLDLNNDGQADFSFANRSYTGPCCGYFRLALTIDAVASANRIWGKGQGNGGYFSQRFASALPAGRGVGANKSYFQGRAGSARMAGILGAGYSSATDGQWPDAHRRYLGLEFVIAGKIHYGWARLNVSSISRQNGITAVLTGYAYETIPGKPIITGKTKGPDVVTLQPATLGHLATGASAIPAWRVKQTAATSH
jgi:hypothetical protein